MTISRLSAHRSMLRSFRPRALAGMLGVALALGAASPNGASGQDVASPAARGTACIGWTTLAIAGRAGTVKPDLVSEDGCARRC